MPPQQWDHQKLRGWSEGSTEKESWWGSAVNGLPLIAERFFGTSLEAPIIQVYHCCFDRRDEGLLAF
jgi:hypothetical protein